MCLTVFLNYPEARANQVFAMVNPNSAPGDPVPEWCTSSQCVEYTLVSTADAERGEAWYNATDGGDCLTCHGQPEDAVGPIADGPAGGLLVFLRQDGKYSEFRHKVQWGESGNDLMSRANMNDPTGAQVADVLAYLAARIDIQVNTDPAAGQALYTAECGVCHAAGSFDTTTLFLASDLGGRGAELVASGRLINNLVDTDPLMVGLVLSDQDILNMVGFLDSL